MKSVAELYSEKMDHMKTVLEQRRLSKEEALMQRMCQDFDNELNIFITEFEKNVFSLKSTNEDVANYIISDKFIVTHKYFLQISFRDVKDAVIFAPGKTSIYTSDKFNQWKDLLENKFKITLNFNEYSTTEITSGDGDYSIDYHGIAVNIIINK